MQVEFLRKPYYGQQAAEVWKEITGNYPVLPFTKENEPGSVLLNSGTKDLHLVGFFGFQQCQDHVIVFSSYFAAEQFYQIASENPHAFVKKSTRLPEPETAEPVVPEAVETPPPRRPKHLYEGSGTTEE